MGSGQQKVGWDGLVELDSDVPALEERTDPSFELPPEITQEGVPPPPRPAVPARGASMPGALRAPRVEVSQSGKSKLPVPEEAPRKPGLALPQPEFSSAGLMEKLVTTKKAETKRSIWHEYREVIITVTIGVLALVAFLIFRGPPTAESEVDLTPGATGAAAPTGAAGRVAPPPAPIPGSAVVFAPTGASGARGPTQAIGSPGGVRGPTQAVGPTGVGVVGVSGAGIGATGVRGPTQAVVASGGLSGASGVIGMSGAPTVTGASGVAVAPAPPPEPEQPPAPESPKVAAVPMLSIFSVPSGATVELNTLVAGKTPLIIASPSKEPMVHVRLTLEHYRAWEGDVHANEGGHYVHKQVLEPNKR